MHINVMEIEHCEQKFSHYKENVIVPSINGLILCLVPSEKGLVGKLKDLGELNRYFAAVTPEGAHKFASLLPRVKPTENNEKPFPIIWGGYLSSVESRKPTTVSHNMNPEARNPNLLEESGSRNLIGMLGNAGRHG